MDKSRWLHTLAEFLVEGHTSCWAGDGAQEPPAFAGMKSLYHRNREWEYRDNYSGYFRAPGSTVVSFRNVPVWQMSYFGEGQLLDHTRTVTHTFAFLKRALLRATPDLPYRGPREYCEQDWMYTFTLLHGGLEDFLARESISRKGVAVFRQTFGGGIIIGRDQDRRPVLPWNV